VNSADFVSHPGDAVIKTGAEGVARAKRREARERDRQKERERERES